MRLIKQYYSSDHLSKCHLVLSVIIKLFQLGCIVCTF